METLGGVNFTPEPLKRSTAEISFPMFYSPSKITAEEIWKYNGIAKNMVFHLV